MLKVLKQTLINCGVKRFKDLDISVCSFKGERFKRYSVITDILVLEYNTLTNQFILTYIDRGTRVTKAHSDITEIQNYIINTVLV